MNLLKMIEICRAISKITFNVSQFAKQVIAIKLDTSGLYITIDVVLRDFTSMETIIFVIFSCIKYCISSFGSAFSGFLRFF